MHCSRHTLFLVFIVLALTSSAAVAGTVPEPVSVTDIPPSNAAELHAHSRAEMTFRQAAQQADAAMKKARAEGGQWREMANLLMQSSVASRSGDFQAATKMANQARFMAEESYDAVIAARKAAAERAAAAKKAEEERAAAAAKAAAEKRAASTVAPTK